MSSLLETFNIFSKHDIIRVDMPSNITDNLATKIKLRPYQIEALERWFYYVDEFTERPSNPHLLFHMATGSGKTVLMAALILDLYKRGYRNFLFFVNSAQIIEKTKDNFLNEASAKHLFKPIMRIDGKPVEIQAVETFDAVSNEAINIHFTTIQGLHTRMHAPKENAVTIEDFRSYKVVMISDEAHHLNAETRNRPSAGEKKNKKSWENTVTRIFHQNSDNVLLEFTATADLNHPAIRQKYYDKILYDYQLKHFRKDGYSKEIELRQADLPPLDRMMQVMILSQYRLKVAEAHRIHCKPVILMKSKTIAASEANESLFISMVKDLSGETLQEVRERALEDESLARAFEYILEERGMEVDEFARELQDAFGDGKIINVNKLKDLEEHQIDLNNLEDQSNGLRVIFAVNKLDEGWDVLNLFDIVRLYDTRDSKGDKIGKTTMSEAQLIGRGARYFPFDALDGSQAAPEKRKYDKDVKHSLRVLEELYYHCSHNPRYIDEIKRALKKIGMGDENTRTVDLRLKESFKNSQFYQIGYVWVNEQIKNPLEGVKSLSAYEIDKCFKYPTLMTGYVKETSAFGSEKTESSDNISGLISRDLCLVEFNRSILDFAMDSNDFFHFVNLKKYFPYLTSTSEFQTSDSYLGSVNIQVRGLRENLDHMTSREKLKIVQYVLTQIEVDVKCESVEFVGTTKPTPRKISECFTDKTLKLRIEGEAGRSWTESHISGLSSQVNLINEDWYAYDDNYGTDQEKYFIRYLNDQAPLLRKQYDDFYLLRNEKAVKIFSFKTGQGFEPDFILFLRKKGEEVGNVLQLFIEPKGKQLMLNDAWKQNFLDEIQWKDRIQTIFHGNEYHVYGLPFFNEDGQSHSKFKDAFEKLMNDGGDGDL